MAGAVPHHATGECTAMVHGTINKSIGIAALGAAALLALTACATGPAGSSGSSGSGSGGGSGEAEPATAQSIVGTWVTGEEYPTAPEVPFLTFADDGTWTGSDGCNGGQGDWSLGDDGSIAASAGMSTLIACEGAQLPAFLTESKLALIDGDSLVLADVDGQPLVTLVAADE